MSAQLECNRGLNRGKMSAGCQIAELEERQGDELNIERVKTVEGGMEGGFVFGRVMWVRKVVG